MSRITKLRDITNVDPIDAIGGVDPNISLSEMPRFKRLYYKNIDMSKLGIDAYQYKSGSGNTCTKYTVRIRGGGFRQKSATFVTPLMRARYANMYPFGNQSDRAQQNSKFKDGNKFKEGRFQLMLGAAPFSSNREVHLDEQNCNRAAIDFFKWWMSVLDTLVIDMIKLNPLIRALAETIMNPGGSNRGTNNSSSSSSSASSTILSPEWLKQAKDRMLALASVYKQKLHNIVKPANVFR